LPIYPAYITWEEGTLNVKRREVQSRLKELSSMQQRVSRGKAKTAAQRRARSRLLRDIERKRKTGAQVLQRIGWLEGLQQSVGGRGSVDFRVLHRVDGYKVELLRSYDPPRGDSVPEEVD
jgi:hypothetical protein